MIGALIRLLRNGVRRLKRAPDHVVIVIEGPYTERRPSGFLQRRRAKGRSLEELKPRFARIAADPRVRGVILHLRPLGMLPALIESLVERIGTLRATGKKVVAWSYEYDTQRYFVACACDRIALQVAGTVEPLGFAVRGRYLGETLRRAGLEADFVQITPYKTAADRIVRSSMSDAEREVQSWLLDDRFEALVDAVSSGRRIDRTAARALIDAAPYTDADALDAGAVDLLCAEDDLPDVLGDGRPARVASWEQASKALLLRRRPRGSKHIALVRIEGIIVDGRSGRPPIPVPVPIVGGDRAGDLTVVQQIRRAERSKRDAAIVVLVDSGGGSPTASEAMAAALRKADARKPVVVSMGGVAASGGYWLATPARWIVARPGTITGSIGVLSGKVAVGGVLDRLSIGRDDLERGEHMRMLSPEMTFSDEERARVRRSIERVYDLFLERVSSSRGLPRDAVDAIGGGRVWTGRQALAHGLVDELGGLDAAVRKARELAGLGPKTQLREVRPSKKTIGPKEPAAAAMISYLSSGAAALGSGAPLVLCPIDYTWQRRHR